MGAWSGPPVVDVAWGMEGGVDRLSWGGMLCVWHLRSLHIFKYEFPPHTKEYTVYILVFATNRSDERFGTADVLPTGHRRHPNDMGAPGEHFS